MPPMNDKSIYLFPTNLIEMKDIITRFNHKKGGIHEIDAQVLKTLKHYISKPLVDIFNTCIENGVWLHALKIAQVIPICKGKEKLVPNNYRPISLISNIQIGRAHV